MIQRILNPKAIPSLGDVDALLGAPDR